MSGPPTEGAASAAEADDMAVESWPRAVSDGQKTYWEKRLAKKEQIGRARAAAALARGKRVSPAEEHTAPIL